MLSCDGGGAMMADADSHLQARANIRLRDGQTTIAIVVIEFPAGVDVEQGQRLYQEMRDFLRGRDYLIRGHF